MQRLVLAVFSWLVAVGGFAQADTATARSVSDYLDLRGYVKNMQIFQMQDLRYIAHANLVHNRLNFRIYPLKSTAIGIEFRNRIFTGDQVNAMPDYARTVDIDRGLTDLSWAWVDEPALVGLTQVDRAWVRWHNTGWDITLGRQRINWGVNAFWNSNDLFNTFNLADFDYEERPGTDAIRVQRFFGNLSEVDVAVAPSKHDSTWIGAGMYRFNKWTYDFQVLGGWWNEDVAVGVGWAGNLKTAGFKGEATYFHPQEHWEDTSGVVSFSTSADYVFQGNLYVMGGFLFNSRGSDTAFNLTALANSAFGSAQLPSAKNLMPAKYSGLLSVSKPITPLVTGSLVGIYSPGVNLLFLMPSVSMAVGSNWEFAVFGQTTFLDSGSAFRNFGTAVFARLKWGF